MVKHTGGKAAGERVRRQHGEPTSATACEPRKLNHAQRKSAERLKKFIESKGARSGQAEEPSDQPSRDPRPQSRRPSNLTRAWPIPRPRVTRMRDVGRSEWQTRRQLPAPSPCPFHRSPSPSSPRQPARSPSIRRAGSLPWMTTVTGEDGLGGAVDAGCSPPTTKTCCPASKCAGAGTPCSTHTTL